MPLPRDSRIDFFRGLALIFIFWDHVPDNPLGLITVRNFGFSDATEIFVFLAGYVAVMAYGKIALRDGFVIAGLKILRRTWVLYVAHIFLSALMITLVIFANSHVETRDLTEELGLHYFLSNPQQAMSDQLLLRFKPHLMDPLPLYVVLLASLPLILPMILRHTWLTVGLSGALYFAARAFDWNLPNHDGGVWYFNPLAWQFLFVLGGAAALYRPSERTDAPRAIWKQPMFVAAAIYLVIAALITLSWNSEPIQAEIMPRIVSDWLYPISKTNLSPVRLLHFLALAYITTKLLPGAAWTRHWLAQRCCRMGQYSLEVFCLGALLIPLTDMLNTVGGDTQVMRIFSAVLGVGLMVTLTLWLDFYKRLSRPRLISTAA